MAKTIALQLETTTFSTLDKYTSERDTNLKCSTYPRELSQIEFIEKVRQSSFPSLPYSSRPSSPSAQPDASIDQLFSGVERLQNANIFEEGLTNKSTQPALDCTHWLEVMDERHRYGSYLRPYYDAWKAIGAPGSFFSWLDYGEGKELDFGKQGRLERKVVSRAYLEKCRVQYCSEEERERYRVVIHDGLLVWASDNAPEGSNKLSVVDTNCEEKWIFVIDVGGNLYVNKKRKGGFHHSSFVSGAPVQAAGRISVQKGIAVCIGPNSGHYKTTWQQLLSAVHSFFGRNLRVVSPLPCAAHNAHCIGVIPLGTLC